MKFIRPLLELLCRLNASSVDPDIVEVFTMFMGDLCKDRLNIEYTDEEFDNVIRMSLYVYDIQLDQLPTLRTFTLSEDLCDLDYSFE